MRAVPLRPVIRSELGSQNWRYGIAISLRTHNPAPQGIASSGESPNKREPARLLQRGAVNSRTGSQDRKLSGGSTPKSPRMEPAPHTPKDGHSLLILTASARYFSSNTLSSSTKM